MPDSFTHENNTADHALFENIKTWAREGYAVISGASVTPGDGDWEVDIDSGEVLVGGDPQTVDNQSLTLSAPGDEPRWDTLVVDPDAASDANIEAVEGVEQETDETSDGHRLTRLETRFPVPADLTDERRTVLAIVWVDPESDQLSDKDVIDRRIDAAAALGGLTVEVAPEDDRDALRLQDLEKHETSTDSVHGVDSTDTVAGQDDVDSTVESHRSDEVHEEPQPPEDHGNEAHSEDFETESGAQQRVDDHESTTTGVHGVGEAEVASTADPVTQFEPGDVSDGEVLINENGDLVGGSVDSDAETDIDLIQVDDAGSLPEPEDVDKPTIAYIDDEDDYAGVFQE